jgi:hypothetical protein
MRRIRGPTRTLHKGRSSRANRGWRPLLTALTRGSGPRNAGPGPPFYRLLRDWEQRATADQQQFQIDANSIIVALQQKVARAFTLLQQMTTQTAEQRQLVDKKLADLACRADKKLKEVDMAITSVSTSISSMGDSLTLAILALPIISDVKRWVTDAVATERLATGFPTVPPPNPPVATVPSPCSPTEHGLAAMELNLATNSRAQDAWARAPQIPSLGINTELYSSEDKAQSDEVPDWNWGPTGGPHCKVVHLGSAGHKPEPERWDISSRMKTAPITVPRAITPVAAQATSMQTRTSIPTTAPGMDMSLETIGQTVTMTGATTGNWSHACHHGRPVYWTHSCFGWSWCCLGPHGTGIVDTRDLWRMASGNTQRVTCGLFMSHRTRGCLS